MANKVFSILFLAFITFAMFANEAMAGGYGNNSLKLSQCASQCDRRCSQTQYHNACELFCNKCCKKCLCVPSGFYGNKEECPCYNNWKTQQGGPKCP